MMAPLYKYLPKQYAEDMVNKGIIQIGTLLGFQNEDKYGEDIGDKYEGTLEEWATLNKINAQQDDLDPFSSRVVSINNTAGGVSFIDCITSTRHEAKDAYIYCTSKVFSLDLMRRISKDCTEKYDVCVKISIPEMFFKAISKEIESFGKFETTASCNYTGRTLHYKSTPSHPSLIKPSKHKYQEEVRSIWSPLDNEKISSKIITIMELAKYCEIHQIDNQRDEFEGLPMVKGVEFEGDVIKLDANAFINCKFKNSQIQFHGEYIPKMNGCTFTDCNWVLCGYAELTFRHLNMIYHDMNEGGQAIVENIFASIRIDKRNVATREG